MSKLCAICNRIENGGECLPDCKKNPKLNAGSGLMIKKECVNYDIATMKHGGMETDVLGNITELQDKFEENTFAEILSAHVIEHFRRPAAREMLKSFYHILRPGGKLILEGPDVIGAYKLYVEKQNNIPLYIQHMFADDSAHITKWGAHWGHLSGWTGETAADACKEAGFNVVHVGIGLTHGMGNRDFRVEAIKTLHP